MRAAKILAPCAIALKHIFELQIQRQKNACGINNIYTEKTQILATKNKEYQQPSYQGCHFFGTATVWNQPISSKFRKN